jgi:ketosteroid isomerase-like protein
MQQLFAALALALFAMSPSHATPEADAMAAVTRFAGAFNSGDAKTMVAMCADHSVIIDEFAPYEWHGADGCAKWGEAYDVNATQNKITGGKVTLGKPLHVDVTNDHAYIVTPVKYEFMQAGKPVVEPSSIITIALVKSANGWRINGWAWSKR